jgi:hypothetical protein
MAAEVSDVENAGTGEGQAISICAVPRALVRVTVARNTAKRRKVVGKTVFPPQAHEGNHPCRKEPVPQRATPSHG